MKIEEFKSALRTLLRYHLEFEDVDACSSYIYRLNRSKNALIDLTDFEPIDVLLVEEILRDVEQALLKHDYTLIVKEPYGN